jgi:hypothetical protein
MLEFKNETTMIKRREKGGLLLIRTHTFFPYWFILQHTSSSMFHLASLSNHTFHARKGSGPFGSCLGLDCSTL